MKVSPQQRSMIKSLERRNLTASVEGGLIWVPRVQTFIAIAKDGSLIKMESFINLFGEKQVAMASDHKVWKDADRFISWAHRQRR